MTNQQEEQTPQGEREDQDPQQQEEAVEPTPSSEEESQDSTPQEEVTEEDALANAKNPERTRKYIEKLKEQARNGSQPNMFDQFRPVPSSDNYQHLDQAQVENIASNYIDDDGNVDIDRLNQALQSANQKAEQAVAQAQQMTDKITRYEESRQLQEAYEKYPQLDPENAKFDPDFYELVSQKIMVENYARGGNLTVKQAGDYIADFYNRPNEAKEKKQAVEEYKKAQENRRQGPISSGKGESRDLANLPELREQSRRGDSSAIAKRLQELGI